MKQVTVKRFPSRLFKMTKAFYKPVPSRECTIDFIEELVRLLFQVRSCNKLTMKEIDEKWSELQQNFIEIIKPLYDQDSEVDTVALKDDFFAEIPLIYTQLMQDAQMYDRCDPASYCMEEVVLCYPGFFAMTIHRLAHVIHGLNIPIVPRILSEYAHSLTGIDIHPGATIGRSLYIDHGTGIVVGETTIIGNNVKLYQGVTLGATFVDKDLKGKRRHPKIENNVIIYAGSTILGGNTVVGHDSVIGGNVWLMESVPPFSTVFHKPEIVIKGKKVGGSNN